MELFRVNKILLFVFLSGSKFVFTMYNPVIARMYMENPYTVSFNFFNEEDKCYIISQIVEYEFPQQGLLSEAFDLDLRKKIIREYRIKKGFEVLPAVIIKALEIENEGKAPRDRLSLDEFKEQLYNFVIAVKANQKVVGDNLNSLAKTYLKNPVLITLSSLNPKCRLEVCNKIVDLFLQTGVKYINGILHQEFDQELRKEIIREFYVQRGFEILPVVISKALEIENEGKTPKDRLSPDQFKEQIFKVVTA